MVSTSYISRSPRIVRSSAPKYYDVVAALEIMLFWSLYDEIWALYQGYKGYILRLIWQHCVNRPLYQPYPQPLVVVRPGSKPDRPRMTLYREVAPGSCK